MAGRFTARRTAAAELPPQDEAVALPNGAAPLNGAALPEAFAWTVFPEAPPPPTPMPPPAPPVAAAPPPIVTSTPAAPAAAPANNPLLTDKLLDAKVRLHRKLIEEINLSALEKLPEDEIRRHVQQLVSQYILVERLALNT